ncbi:hypothetical protein [Deinococcus kurensis]|uniref:hypothetical protein n=1 Tax=Deinococcus kurensis TaxID=2662757 RepID=UPI0012D2C5C1|nr:hypothetical protein [Deinococcus kurensis]
MPELNDHQRAVLGALRSSAYNQIIGELRDNRADGTSCFCAEGVIADVAANYGFGEWTGETFCSKYGDITAFSFEPIEGFNIDRGDLYVPSRLLGQFATPEQMSTFGRVTAVRVSTLNDSGFTFAQIADILERTWTRA